MQMVVTAKQMAEMDSATIEKLGIPGIVLMENAGRGVVELAIEMLGTVKEKDIDIFCGPGNNGGDGFVVARHLVNMGAHVRVWLVGNLEKVTGDALTNLRIFQNMGHTITEVTNPEHVPFPLNCELIIDALLGTGVTGELRDPFTTIVDQINSSAAPVLSIDIPTGVNADTGSTAGAHVCATVTATMALHKRGLLLPPGRDHAGDVHVVDISMSDMILDSLNSRVYLITINDVENMLPNRPTDAFKNKCGTAVVVAGSVGFTGAASLTAEGVLRSGAGLCYLATTISLNSIFEEKLSEVITIPFEDDDDGFLKEKIVAELASIAKRHNVLAMGPGLGTHPETVALIDRLLEMLDMPIVLDADGINALTGSLDRISNYKNDIILTPHPGELSRLIGKTTKEIVGDRIEIVRDIAQTLQAILVLKGSPTVIGHPDGTVYINSTGNAGMATGGAGDVLTGVIAGLYAQGLTGLESAVAGVYIHGLAGDIAKTYRGEMGMIAGDIVDCIPDAILKIKNERDNEF